MKKRIRALTLTPARLWAYAQRYPYAAIGYGTILLLSNFVARPLIVAAAGSAILGGIVGLYRRGF